MLDSPTEAIKHDGSLPSGLWPNLNHNWDQIEYLGTISQKLFPDVLVHYPVVNLGHLFRSHTFQKKSLCLCSLTNATICCSKRLSAYNIILGIPFVKVYYI